MEESLPHYIVRNAETGATYSPAAINYRPTTAVIKEISGYLSTERNDVAISSASCWLLLLLSPPPLSPSYLLEMQIHCATSATAE